MSPTSTSAIISENTPDILYTIIEGHNGIKPQIIISKSINDLRYTYNFNGEIEEATMELTYGMNLLFDLPEGRYKRTIAPDCSYINIFPYDESGTTNTPESSEVWPVNNDNNLNNDTNSQIIRTNDVFAIIEDSHLNA